jgi:site-specific DNA-methyltransferase (adenine-specific)
MAAIWLGVVEEPMPKPDSVDAEGEDSVATSHSPGRPTILPSQSTDHCTPPVVAEGIIYPVLGDPVDLDPCSNPDSIICARRCVILPENGLEVDWRGTVFCNPPYGSGIEDWIKKCAESYRLNGAEVIGLFPAAVSSEWFDMVVATAQAAFFWGPGDGRRRLQFVGTKGGGAFASVIAYWGPNLSTFVRHAIRYCHPWFPEYDLRLVRAMLADANGSGECVSSLAVVDDMLVQGRHDDLAAALVALGDTTLGQIMDHGQSALLHRIRSLSAYELASALICSARPGTHWLERRLPRTSQIRNPQQSHLQFASEASAGLARTHEESLDELVFRLITRSDDGMRISDLIEQTKAPRGCVRGALRRLRNGNKVIKTGTTKMAAYRVAQEEGRST